MVLVRNVTELAPLANRRIAIFHLDLGIGGAERLILDCATAFSDLLNDNKEIRERQQKITIFTTRFSSCHCFPECNREDLSVVTYGSWIPRTVFGKCTLLMATVRLLYLSFVMFILQRMGFLPKFDLILSDNLASLNPLLKKLCKRLYFYCHFPETLMETKPAVSVGRKLYRNVFEKIEERGFRCCDYITTNSAFSKDNFEDAFPTVNAKRVSVLYPPVSVPDEHIVKDLTNANSELSLARIKNDRLKNLPKLFFVSLNRFEQKKRHEVALEAFSVLLNNSEIAEQNPALVIAGGFDSTLPHNLTTMTQLQMMVHSLPNLSPKNVFFMKSIDTPIKEYILANAIALLYTPINEHFGIVPVECMSFGTPTIATNTGGPRETVVDSVTGSLCGPTAADFAACMKKHFDFHVKASPEVMDAQRQRCRERAQLFNYEAFVERIQGVCKIKP